MANPKTYYDLVVIIPLEEELITFLEVFPSIKDRSTELILKHEVNTGVSDLSALVIQQQGMGKTHAVNCTASILADCDVGLMVCLGIAGGLSHDLKLGDVCYSGSIIDVLDNSKIVDLDDAATATELSPTHFATPIEFVTAFNFVRTQPELRPSYIEWQIERAKIAKQLVPQEVPIPNSGNEILEKPESMSGAIVCGAVSKSAIYNQKLRGIDRALLAIETESGGVFSQSQLAHTPAITIRGISDYADKDKGRLEASSKGGVRKLAASNASSFLQLQLSNSRFLAALRKRRTGPQSTMNLSRVEITSDPLVDAISQIQTEISEALNKLSPEYRLHPKGYRLPTPRFRQVFSDNGLEKPEIENEMIGVHRLIDLHDRALVNLPRSYPDQSFAWVVTEALLSAEVDGRQVVPIYIDGEEMRGAKFDFSRLATVNFEDLQSTCQVQIVFVIDNAPIDSKHRLELLLENVTKQPEAKFIFVAKTDSSFISEADFISRSASTEFELSPISFLEIAHFIQKNFDMGGSESEVVALRLRDTFDRFSLEAHPTYFAGIPKETLAALLQANRRSELIQLAVDGFLTFLVADDRADITLSRTTRSRFLRKLVLKINVEKETFDQASLLTFTKSFADDHDFDIDPLDFVSAFVKQGIIHFEMDRVHISLPFIESYLLASELSLQPDIAKRYFDFEDDLFDMTTFDLYAEIGASTEIINSICDRLQTFGERLGPLRDIDHILLSEQITPHNLVNPERSRILRKKLTSAIQAVTEGKNESEEKQRIIDLSERVNQESSRHQRKTHQGPDDVPATEREQLLSDAGRVWTIATILLGSGAEHLDARTKRTLSAEIVNCGSSIVDDWTKFRMEIDFQALKERMLSDEIFGDLPGPEDVAEKRRYIEGMVDMFEYSALSDPLRRVIGFLCEQARHQVLANSIEHAQTHGKVAKLIHYTWLADINATRGKKKLLASIDDLPRAAFLRLTVVTHFLSRVYWNHWKKDDRLALLDAAEFALKPIDMSINSPEIKRMISREAKKGRATKRDR